MANLLRISEAASLALHTMVLLAGEPDERLSIRAIVAALPVSEAHLAKVLQRLSKAGLIRSVRGPRGGWSLARPSEEITLLDVYEAMEGRVGEGQCLLGEPVCGGGERCVLGGLVQRVNQEVRETLGRRKLADFAVQAE